MKAKLKTALAAALREACGEGKLPQTECPEFALDNTKQADHGDLAANLAMILARPCKMKPRDIAQILVDRLGDAGGVVAKAEIAGPGFINFFLKPEAWLNAIPEVLAKGDEYGRGTWGEGQKAMVEFVSANPTGPLHVGHGRGAALGDALARLLRMSGFVVESEYYINDAGNQMATLGRSVLVRARQARGSDEPFPDNHYRGDYISGLAREFLDLPQGRDLLNLPQEEAVEKASAWAGGKILDGIREDLGLFRVGMDNWYSERSLFSSGAVERAFEELKKRDLLYESEGALWFAASRLGDEKDRVVRRGNGETTYFASDIAYHLDKFARGFTRLIDVWGADHHGYVPRLKAALAGMDRKPEDLSVVLVQMVNLLRGGQPVAMSTRAGEFVTLREVLDEVGADAARFLFLTRRSDAQLDFDLDVAKAHSMDNPVYYVQYAHTRVKAVFRKAAEAGVEIPALGAADISKLALTEEVDLAKRMSLFPELVEGAARALEPHRITYYLHELAGDFHSYYNGHRILEDDPALAGARLALAAALGQVLKNGLELLGVSAPGSM